MVTRFVAATILSVVLAFAATAGAQTTPSTEAEVLFQRGVALGEVERWLEAHELFRQSFAIVERPTTLFNMAYALFRAGRFHGAVMRLDQLLVRPDVGDRRLDAQRLRAEALAQAAQLTLEITPPESTVEMDGERTAESGSRRVLPVDPGLHRLIVRAPGHAERHLDLTIAPGERAGRTIDLEPAALPVTVESTEAPRGVVDEPVFWVLLVSGVLVVAGGVTVGVLVGGSPAPTPYGGSAGVVVEALRF